MTITSAEQSQSNESTESTELLIKEARDVYKRQALRGYNLRKVVRETAIEQNECMTRVRHEGAVDPKWATF